MKAMSLVIGAILIILLMAAGLTAITNFRSAAYVEPHVVTTGGGITTADVVLTQSLFDDDTSFVTVTSNVTGDAAIPSSYVAATKILTVGGLLASESHYLYVTYRYGQLTSYWGADLAARTWPIFLILGIIGIIVGAVIIAAKGES